MISKIAIESFLNASTKSKEIISTELLDSLTADSCCILTSANFTAEDNARVIHILKTLFERPMDDKLKFASLEPLMPGFSPYGRSKALDTGIKNTLETWDIDLLAPVKFPKEMENDWHFLISYQNKIFDLISDFFQFLSFGIKVNPTIFLDLLSRKNGGIHFIHYLPFEETFHPEARRQSKHCDMTLITVIPAASEVGLEVELKNKWVSVPLHPSEFLIQVGMLLERMFGDRIKACLHTVETYENIKLKHRYAFPYFVSPAGEKKISVIDKFTSKTLKQKYPEDLVKNINADYFSKIFKSDN